MNRRLLVGVSGASGAPLAVELLRRLRAGAERPEIHLIITRGGEMTLKQEMGLGRRELEEMADVCYDNSSIGAAPASGSFRNMGMIIVPCSMKTVAGIVSGYSDNLLLRAADVMLKERRRLVLVAREAPLSTLHLRNLYEVSRLGAVVFPPVLTCYSRPSSLDEWIGQTADRILSLFGLEQDGYQWEGMDGEN